MANKRNLRPFVGVDGEGGDINGRHEYLLLRAGDHVLETGYPLDWRDIIPWIASLPTDVEYVSYFFDYDVTMCLRGLPPDRITRLLDRESRTFADDVPPWPVDIGAYQIDYLPHKEFRVRRTGQPWVIISDTGTFFQTAFLKALQKWGVGSQSTLSTIGAGKESRATFGAMTDETRKYNHLECELLAILMEQFRNVCLDVGYVPKQWQGPGNLATAMLRKHSVPRTKDLPSLPDGLLRMAQAAYYGGRFERTAAGPVCGPVYQYDINSAYPYALTLLPCLMHGTWSHHVRIPPYMQASLRVSRISFATGADALLGSFPIRRKDGSIHFPLTGQGWYWSYEIESARAAGTIVKEHETWVYTSNCNCRIFSPWIEEVYAERLRLGKTARGIVLKLGPNSIYGKEAQSIGAAPYANPIYAGIITSIVRALLISAYSSAPNECMMLATDGLFMTKPLPQLTVGTGLGEWDLTTHEQGMFIIQPGLYFAGEQLPKTRGVPMGKIYERREEFARVWSDSPFSEATSNLDRNTPYPSVEIPIRNFISLRLASARGKLETAGQWVDDTRTVSFDWSNKRRPYKIERDSFGLRLFPYDGIGDRPTVPYRRNIGGNLTRHLERLAWMDAPDWYDGLRPIEM